MSQESRQGRLHSDPATNTHREGTSPGYPTRPIKDQLGDWWNDPALSYWVGLQDGVELARRQDEEDHRNIVRGLVRFIEVADSRAAERERVDACPGCNLEICRCPSLDQVPFGRWHSDRPRRRERAS